MKHLKAYNEASVSLSDLELDLKDIFSDIDDMNFITNVSYNPKGHSDKEIFIFWISRLRNREGFIKNEKEYNMLRNELNRIKEYVESHGCVLKPFSQIDFIKHINEMDMDEFNRLMDTNRFTIDYLIKKR